MSPSGKSSRRPVNMTVFACAVLLIVGAVIRIVTA